MSDYKSSPVALSNYNLKYNSEVGMCTNFRTLSYNPSLYFWMYCLPPCDTAIMATHIASVIPGGGWWGIWGNQFWTLGRSRFGKSLIRGRVICKFIFRPQAINLLKLEKSLISQTLPTLIRDMIRIEPHLNYITDQSKS